LPEIVFEMWGVETRPTTTYVCTLGKTDYENRED